MSLRFDKAKMKWVTWQALSSSAESYSRRLASSITIAAGMKEPHSESVMPLWLQLGARASLKTVSCANLSGALWGRWKGATEETIGSTWLGLGVCPQTRVVRWGHQLTHFASDWAALKGQGIDLAPKLGMCRQPYPQASGGSVVGLTLSPVYSWWQLVSQGRKVWIWSFAVIFM